MSAAGLAVFGVAAAGYLSLALLTGSGARRRGAGTVLTALSATMFPATWVAWYVRDGARRPGPPPVRRPQAGRITDTRRNG